MEQLELPNTIDHMLECFSKKHESRLIFWREPEGGRKERFFFITIGGRRKVPGGRPAAAKMPLRLAIL